MNRKGFTLIELLAVLVVLGIVLVISIPSITDAYKNSKINPTKLMYSIIITAPPSFPIRRAFVTVPPFRKRASRLPSLKLSLKGNTLSLSRFLYLIILLFPIQEQTFEYHCFIFVKGFSLVYINLMGSGTSCFNGIVVSHLFVPDT